MVARFFLVSSVIYGLVGLALGLHMAIGGDHGQLPTHAHIMVLGWLSFFGFGLYYHLFSAAADGLFAKGHFWLAQFSAPAIFIGLAGLYGAWPELEPMAAIGSIVYAASFLAFAVVLVRTSTSKPN